MVPPTAVRQSYSYPTIRTRQPPECLLRLKRVYRHACAARKQLVVRDCVVDNGGFSAETEIGRISHCGFFTKVEMFKQKYRGCLMACNTDGCNASPPAAAPAAALLALLAAAAALSIRSLRSFGGFGA